MLLALHSNPDPAVLRSSEKMVSVADAALSPDVMDQARILNLGPRVYVGECHHLPAYVFRIQRRFKVGERCGRRATHSQAKPVATRASEVGFWEEQPSKFHNVLRFLSAT